MTKRRIAATAFLAAAMAGSAMAADLPSRKGPPPAYIPPPPVMTWTGLYAGLNIGGGWDAGNGNGNAFNLFGMNGGVTNRMSGGVIGGGQIGYNYQLASFVLGVETDFQGSSMGGSMNRWAWVPDGFGGFIPANVAGGTSLNWFGTVRGRVGYLITPTILLYGTGGFAYAGVQRNGGAQTSGTQTGWTAGGGVEWMFMPNWSAKAEYLYSDVSGSNQNWGWNAGLGVNNVNNHTRWNTVRAGVNYHFNIGGSAPTLARY